MPMRFMTDPHQMRAMADRFDVHAQPVEDEARRMWACSQKHCQCRLEWERATPRRTTHHHSGQSRGA